MSYTVYIIYSPKLDRFYIGETVDFYSRMIIHLTHAFKGSYTSSADDWETFLTIPCSSRLVARNIEAFIKKQKSRKFILSLKENPEKLKSIISRFSEGHSPDVSGRTQ